MKAYKQINLSFENRIVFGYAGMMSMLSFLILLSPVFAQDNEPLPKNEPNVQYDVKKEYDKDGNLTGYDSTFTWYRSDKGFGMQDYDSLIEHFNQQFNLSDENWNWFGLQPFPSNPPIDHFWYWNDRDSSVFLQEDSTLNNYIFDNSWSQMPPAPNHWNIPFDDTLGLSFYNFDDLSKFFNHDLDLDKYFQDKGSMKKYREQQEEFMEKFKEYQKEHQKLIEKYFGEPYQNRESEPQKEQQKLKTPAEPKDDNRSGKI
jgi:hypothetical protein